MKKVLGLVGSNRRLGNSEIMVKEVFQQIQEDCELAMIRLFKLNLTSCKGCYACLKPEVNCSIKDDFNFVLDEITKADYLIIAAPCYWLGAVAPIKCMIDRTFETYRVREILKKIRTVTILTAGMKIFRGHGQEDLNVLARECGLKLVDSCVAWGTMPGEAVLDQENIKYAKRLATALTDTSYQKELSCNQCPTCWSDILRIKKDLSLECPTCNAQGNYVIDGEGRKKIEFWRHGRYVEGKHEHDHRGHLEWLLGKKNDFNEKKELLEKTREKYKDLGVWIEPA